jgi:hypothetical protein
MMRATLLVGPHRKVLSEVERGHPQLRLWFEVFLVQFLDRNMNLMRFSVALSRTGLYFFAQHRRF